MRYLILFLASLFIFSSCGKKKFNHNASGVFEATEVVVSAKTTGVIEEFDLKEADLLTEGQCLGHIDTTQLYLKKLQLLASAKAIEGKRPDIHVQVSSLKEQIAKAQLERQRIQNLLKDGAATQKQLDDINSQLSVLNKSLSAQLNTLSKSVNTLNEESNVYQIQAAQIDDMLEKSRIINPINGTVLNKYAEEKEVANQGRALYKIANLEQVYLRAYVVSPQLGSIQLGQGATVYINGSDNRQRTYRGKVAWISDKAEFTPKTIQTQDERENLVYAVKIAVENNDGLIKIGMYGDVDFN